jgi:hypothetical protein
MVRTTATSIRARAAAQAREATARRTSLTPIFTPPPPATQFETTGHLSPVPDDEDLEDLIDPDVTRGHPGNIGPGGGDGGPPDDVNPEDDPNSSSDSSDDVPNLAVAINKLAKSVRRPSSDSKTKTSEPDTFDGQDPKKLRNFQVQCELNFRDRPKAFRTNASRVTYALSYLRGAALEWFEPSILEGTHEAWENDYQLFLDELRMNFGPFDPVGDAETELENLRMSESHRYVRFVLIFNRHASQVQWNDQALCHAFYRALPTRLKDEISRVDRPSTLRGLKILVRQLDSRYWRRQDEIKRENRSKSSSTNDNSKPAKNKANTTSSTTPKPSSASTSTPSGSTTAAKPAKKTTEDLTGKLGKDGKLTTEERNRRILNNLCLFCGATGHRASDCKKATKARAAKTSETTETSEAKSSTDAKK